MTVERILRGVAGCIILASLLLAYIYSANWLWLTTLVGVNLLQSAVTNWCPAMVVLRKLGLSGCGD
ncbi:MAG: DUF2892 domain-containing protein [Pseudodesulfovibrio sp.]